MLFPVYQYITLYKTSNISIYILKGFIDFRIYLKWIMRNQVIINITTIDDGKKKTKIFDFKIHLKWIMWNQIMINITIIYYILFRRIEPCQNKHSVGKINSLRIWLVDVSTDNICVCMFFRTFELPGTLCVELFMDHYFHWNYLSTKYIS